MKDRYTFKKYFNFNSSLKKEWESLELKVDYSPFHSYEWLSHWYNNIGKQIKNYNLSIIVIKLNGEVTDIFPLCVIKKKFTYILEWIGGINTDYMGSLHDHNSILKSKLFTHNQIWILLKKNISKFDLIYLDKQPDYFGLKMNFFLNFFKKEVSYLSHKANFTKNWNNYKIENIKKKILNDNKRQIKRLKKHGELKFIVTNEYKERQNIINEMIIQKEEKYKRGNYNMFKKQNYKNLYLKCNNNLGKYGTIHVSCLKVNSEIIATHWGFVSNDTFYYIMPSYNLKKYGKYSPGTILLENLMQWANDNGLKYFDFTEGYAKYKKNWSNSINYLYKTIYPNSIKGILFIIIKKIRNLIKTN